MFHWPIELTAFSLGSAGVSRSATLEVTPRGAAFTLAALSHVGHPAHLALADAFVKGQMRLTPSASIGEDTILVVSALVAPLITAHELGLERFNLSDLVLLPRTFSYDFDDRRNARNWPVRGPDSPRFLFRSPRDWIWVRTAERFEQNGCAGTPNPGVASPWYDAIVSLPRRPHANDWLVGNLTFPPIEAEMRQATCERAVPTVLVHALRRLGAARFARAAPPLRRAAEEAIHRIGSEADGTTTLRVQEIQAEKKAAGRIEPHERRAVHPHGLAKALLESIHDRAFAEATLLWHGLEVDVSLVPELDGYQTLCLLPPAATDPPNLFEAMRDMAWETIEGLIGRSLPERRTEPITLRLVENDGRATTLDVGVSVVIVRNQTVFAAWVGSDGRVMLKLFPPGGMPGR